MGIDEQVSLLHWNYFLSIESDLDKVSRYVEFTTANYRTYSIELARILLAAASEVDVVAKELCKLLAPKNHVRNIEEYRAVVNQQIPEFSRERVFVPRYGLSLHPWTNWRPAKNESPLWWRSYNNVKHERNAHFADASLKNTINSVAALLVMVAYYYKVKFEGDGEQIRNFKDVTFKLQPYSILLRLQDSYYRQYRTIG